ncbi:MAG: Fur family transcriptional regulator [Thermovenabulum sp.]|uniref:Fur family transcriptional regulator n=1 Tax=Thermovenabulum sp. TaxID=3100335 RepID=UPI003C7A38CA
MLKGDGRIKNANFEFFSNYLAQKGLKPSFIRVKILEYLVTKKTHPTADEIYNNLITEIPTLSKTTVYNTLNAFLKSDIAKMITIEQDEARYDADTSDHGHFKCENCGTVYDFKFKMSDIVYTDLEGFEIKSRDLYFKGLCPKCKNKKF